MTAHNLIFMLVCGGGAPHPASASASAGVPHPPNASASGPHPVSDVQCHCFKQYLWETEELHVATLLNSGYSFKYCGTRM